MSTNPRFVTRPPKADKRRDRREYDKERKDRVMVGDVLGFIRKRAEK